MYVAQRGSEKSKLIIGHPEPGLIFWSIKKVYLSKGPQLEKISINY